MALLYGNPNQLTFTFDKIYEPVGGKTAIVSRDDDKKSIMLGRFVLTRDVNDDVYNIDMRVKDGYQTIGKIPSVAAKQEGIKTVNIYFTAMPTDEGRNTYTLHITTEIKLQETAWGTNQDGEPAFIFVDNGATRTIKNDSAVDITFADSDEINFFTDKDGSIKLGLNTKSIATNKIADKAITSDKIADETITADKMSFTAENILTWWQKLGLDTTIQGLQEDIETINDALIPINHEFEVIDGELSTIKNDIEEKSVSVETKISTGTHIATIKVGDKSATEYKIYAPETQSGIDETSLEKYLQDNEYTTETRVGELIDSRDYVTPGFVAANYVNKDYATDNFITKNEVTGTINIIGFDKYINETDNLFVNVYNISNNPIFEEPISIDATLTGIPYGQYFIAKVDAIGNTGKDYQIDNTYPKIYCTVGYNSSETIDVSDWASYVLNSNSWTKIKDIASRGLAQQYWSLGDTKNITIGNISYKATVLGFNHDGTNTITFGLCNFENGIIVSGSNPPCLYEGSSQTFSGGISAATLNNDIENIAPLIIEQCGIDNLKTVTNKYFYVGSSIEQNYFTDPQYIFIPSEKEIIGSWNTEPSMGAGPKDSKDEQYEFFKLNPFMSNRLYNRSHSPNYVSIQDVYTWRLIFRRVSDTYTHQSSSYAPRNKNDNIIDTYELKNAYRTLQHSPSSSLNAYDYLFMWVIG